MADIISELVGLEDAELLSRVGLDKQLKNVREGLEAANALEGKARTKVVEDLERRMAPSPYVFEDLKWQAKQATQKEKTGCSPGEVVSCCCGD